MSLASSILASEFLSSERMQQESSRLARNFRHYQRFIESRSTSADAGTKYSDASLGNVKFGELGLLANSSTKSYSAKIAHFTISSIQQRERGKLC